MWRRGVVFVALALYVRIVRSQEWVARMGRRYPSGPGGTVAPWVTEAEERVRESRAFIRSERRRWGFREE